MYNIKGQQVVHLNKQYIKTKEKPEIKSILKRWVLMSDLKLSCFVQSQIRLIWES